MVMAKAFRIPDGVFIIEQRRTGRVFRFQGMSKCKRRLSWAKPMPQTVASRHKSTM
jgi:hypothetical protein